jgi:acetoacetyl-CoA synthetase
VVDLEYLGRPSWMALFVVLREGLLLDEALKARLKTAIREALSARHVPDDIVQAPAVPRTLSGKKMELPVKKLLLGADAAQVMNRDAMANADCVGWYGGYAERLKTRLG